MNAHTPAAAPAAPYDFDEFDRRRGAAQYRRSVATWSASGAVAALAMVSVLALLSQAPEPAAIVGSPPSVQVPLAPPGAEVPALVNLEQFELTSQIEDHIAVLDAEISAARVEAVPADQLRRLEATREELNLSLQRVSYAHTLLSL